ncbi:hypothetical protein HSBGL_0286 [Halapricum desulfuricans]|uniref:Uncharacterized protein n=1 Tax=Halapricum desulfuricans TaxID=2841257 RepID=A0A897NE75_9EURY|nr:hypothetical protein HSBGL_0286 [Halapricum desulfuricans]
MCRVSLSQYFAREQLTGPTRDGTPPRHESPLAFRDRRLTEGIAHVGGETSHIRLVLAHRLRACVWNVDSPQPRKADEPRS